MKFVQAIFEKFRNSYMLKNALKIDYSYQLKILLNDCSTELRQIVYIFIAISNRLTPHRSFMSKTRKFKMTKNGIVVP